VACFNLAVASLHLDDTLSMFNELRELEIYVTPDMNVYKNLILTGMDQIMFKQEFILKVQLLEEMLYMALNDSQPISLSEEQTKRKID
jgi:hypothetical protein